MDSTGVGGWFEDIPLDQINTILKLYGYRLVNEDMSDLEVLLCGTEGRAEFGIAPINQDIFSGTILLLTWYKSTHKRARPYDVVCYMSAENNRKSF